LRRKLEILSLALLRFRLALAITIFREKFSDVEQSHNFLSKGEAEAVGLPCSIGLSLRRWLMSGLAGVQRTGKPAALNRPGISPLPARRIDLSQRYQGCADL
jgi:hypothetical protein